MIEIAGRSDENPTQQANSSAGDPYPYRKVWSLSGDPFQSPFGENSRIYGDILTHKRLLIGSAVGSISAAPLYYMTASNSPNLRTINSSNNLIGSVSGYYRELEVQLNLLANSDDEDEMIEKGAINTALKVIDHLQESNMAPPVLTSHGGDAVVMLWALGDTTYAITVTDGEIGYVVRQNRKAIRMADSIKLDAFQLEDLR